MKIKRLGGMASVLLLVSFLSPVKVTANEKLSEDQLKTNSIEDRIAAVHNKLETAEQEFLTSEQGPQKINDVLAQWGDWYDWGDWNNSWNDWVDWGDWGDWGDWNDWVDWGDWGDWGNWGDWVDWGDWGDWYNY